MAAKYDKTVRTDQQTMDGLQEVIDAVPYIAHYGAAIGYLLDHWRRTKDLGPDPAKPVLKPTAPNPNIDYTAPARAVDLDKARRPEPARPYTPMANTEPSLTQADRPRPERQPSNQPKGLALLQGI